ncbi:hypothetical protein [Deinococcus pimensis]|uniref:hypothetical protein n=1 Tax=Deinococcus pimensis TaxID=309888 RepID=UPI000480FE4D|nr:hypothetical protein [Deinococcus pimensis]
MDKPNVWAGGVLVGLGLLFLAQSSFGVDLLHGWNWWAVFILIPALAAFSRAQAMYRARGTLDAATRGVLVGGLFPFVVALIFLLNLDWGRVWPIFVILAGVSALLARPGHR